MCHYPTRELMMSFAGAALFICICAHCCWSQNAMYEVKLDDGVFIKQSSEKFEISPTAGTLIEVSASKPSKFLFPYYLYIPSGLPKNGPVRLLVEPNNSGTTSDDFEFHRQSAKDMVLRGYPRQLSDRLRTPLLVPVFPRTKLQWDVYTQALSRKCLLVEDDNPLHRIDLQLLAMIQHARDLLRGLGIQTKPRIFMDGFSASGSFVDRFAVLHPESIRALAAGGINGLPLFPIGSYQDVSLPFPLGVADFKSLVGVPFDAESYRRVSQYLYMGALDDNDTFPHSDAWDDDERVLIAKLFGCKMMPDRWTRSQKIISGLDLPIQTVTYRCAGHDPGPALDDVVAFFKANEGDEPETIIPHQCP